MRILTNHEGVILIYRRCGSLVSRQLQYFIRRSYRRNDSQQCTNVFKKSIRFTSETHYTTIRKSTTWGLPLAPTSLLNVKRLMRNYKHHKFTCLHVVIESFREWVDGSIYDNYKKCDSILQSIKLAKVPICVERADPFYATLNCK
jgi:hypothetical protein